MSSTAAALVFTFAIFAVTFAEKGNDLTGYQADLGVVRQMVQSEFGYTYRTMSNRKDTTADIVSISLGLSENQRSNRVSSWSLFTSDVDGDGAIVPKSEIPTTMWGFNNHLEPQAKGTGSAQDQIVFEWAVLGDAEKIASYETSTNVMIPCATQDDFWTYYTLNTSARLDCEFASGKGSPQGWMPSWQANYVAAAGTTMGEKAKAYLTVQTDNPAPWIFNSRLCDKDQKADSVTSFAADGCEALLKNLVGRLLQGPISQPEGIDKHNEILIKDMMMRDDADTMVPKDYLKAMILPYGSNLIDQTIVETNVEMLWQGLKGVPVSWWTFANKQLNPDGKPGKMVSILDEKNPACAKGDGSEETIKACCQTVDEGVKAYCEFLSKKGYSVRVPSAQTLTV